MDIVSKKSALTEQIRQYKQQKSSIAFVPTMGNLHQGHLSLVKLAKQHADKVVVSIFVNPTQFAENEDYSEYPRTLAQDIQQLQPLKVDMLFTPDLETIYPKSNQNITKVVVEGASDILCGAFRSGHFSGVTTIVLKLFHLVQPDVAIFGQKDYQQWWLIQCMVQDLDLPVRILSHPIVRESDGLAMSSRNSYLSPLQRRQAVLLSQLLQKTARQIKAGATNFIALQSLAVDELRQQQWQVDYFTIINANDLSIATIKDKSLVIMAAATLGQVRLIDNIKVDIV